MKSLIEPADRVSRRRAYVAPFLGVAALSVQQWLFFGRKWDAISPLQLGVWAGLAGFALLALLAGGSWFYLAEPASIRGG